MRFSVTKYFNTEEKELAMKKRKSNFTLLQNISVFNCIEETG